MSERGLGIDGVTIGALIGRGGFGRVYRAHDDAHDRDVAVKVLSASPTEVDRSRFDRERQAMGRVGEHPNIVQVLGSGYTDAGEPYLVMEYATGGSLADRLAANGPLPWPEAVEVVRAACAGAQAAHDAGILHRDIKPENILLSRYGVPKLTDFGIATLAGGTTTASGASASLAHASPELLEGRPLTAAADVYALGSTLFTLIAGHPPFRRSADDAPATMVRRILAEPVPDLRPLGVPDDLATEIERSMQKEPAQRHPSAAALAAALGALGRPSGPVAALAGVAGAAGPEATVTGGLQRAATSPTPAAVPLGPPPAAPRGRSGPDRRVLVGAAAAVLVLGGAVAAFALGGGDDDQDVEVAGIQEVATTTTAAADPADPVADTDKPLPTVTIDCPTSITVGVPQTCQVVSDGAVSGTYRIPGLTQGAVALATVPGTDPVVVQPTDPALAGQSITMTVRVVDADARSASARHTFTVVADPAATTTSTTVAPPVVPAGPTPTAPPATAPPATAPPATPAPTTAPPATAPPTTAAPAPTIAINCGSTVQLFDTMLCDIVTTNAVSGSWSVPGFALGSMPLEVVPGINTIFIEPTDFSAVDRTFRISVVVQGTNGQQVSASHAFTVIDELFG